VSSSGTSTLRSARAPAAVVELEDKATWRARQAAICEPEKLVEALAGDRDLPLIGLVQAADQIQAAWSCRSPRDP